LTWVDPVTVADDVNLNGVEEKLQGGQRRLDEFDNRGKLYPNSSPAFGDHQQIQQQQQQQQWQDQQSHRRLGSKPKKSHIHGTNGYMVPLPTTSELLGIAHFHRPEDRRKSTFALHGHHYTHAFFTIAREGGDPSNPFKLKRLSNEFVFRANSLPKGMTELPHDADVIQFASGIDVVGNDVDGRLVVSYGINDCEGGVFGLAMELVQEMLREVGPGEVVVDLMETIKR